MHADDITRLHHMRDAAREALAFAAGKSRSDLNDNRMLVLSLVKDIEILGEAASRVSGEFKSLHPEIAWPDIVAIRNRLIHVYFDVDLDIVWQTVAEDLPLLAEILDRLLRVTA